MTEKTKFFTIDYPEEYCNFAERIAELSKKHGDAMRDAKKDVKFEFDGELEIVVLLIDGKRHDFTSY